MMAVPVAVKAGPVRGVRPMAARGAEIAASISRDGVLASSAEAALANGVRTRVFRASPEVVGSTGAGPSSANGFAPSFGVASRTLCGASVFDPFRIWA